MNGQYNRNQPENGVFLGNSNYHVYTNGSLVEENDLGFPSSSKIIGQVEQEDVYDENDFPSMNTFDIFSENATALKPTNIFSPLLSPDYFSPRPDSTSLTLPPSQTLLQRLADEEKRKENNLQIIPRAQQSNFSASTSIISLSGPSPLASFENMNSNREKRSPGMSSAVIPGLSRSNSTDLDEDEDEEEEPFVSSTFIEGPLTMTQNSLTVAELPDYLKPSRRKANVPTKTLLQDKFLTIISVPGVKR